jgi:cytochrome oxidase assembly protein ShyY1
MCLTAGQTSDHIGAKILYPCLPDDSQAVLIADRGYDSDEYRAALEAKGITP